MRFDALQFVLFVVIALVIFFGGFIAGTYSYEYYYGWQQQRAVQAWADAFEEKREQDEAQKMADTFGGKTPQETLQMFIEAVEQGDYELASKYFVEEKQEEWRSNLVTTNKSDKINTFLSLVREASGYLEKNYEDVYIANKPVYIRIILYPNDIWKLTDI